MQENNVIYEITKQMQDKDVLKKDMEEAFTLVSNLFKEKYTKKIQLELNNQISKINKNPPKEITLIKALKPFLNEKSYNDLDNVINLIIGFSAVNSLSLPKENDKESTVYINRVIADPSIKDDGVYDIDDNCFFSGVSTKEKSKSILPILLIMFLFNRN